MVYMAKTGTITTNTIFKTNRIFGTSSSFSTSYKSVEKYLLVWLIYGLLPCTQTAGIGSNPPSTINSDGPLSSLLPLARQSTGTTNGNNNLNSDFNNYQYNCATPCQCEYSSSSQTLEIRCSSSESGKLDHKIDLSLGVRTLVIREAQLVDAKSVERIVPHLKRNSLVELDLEQVSIEPKSFFASHLFRENEQSLRRLTIKEGTIRGDSPVTTDLAADSIRALLQPLASLQSLDSLSICDSSHSLATLLLQAMPAVKNLRAVNNSLCEIPYESLTANYHQYSAIESVDFSKNHLTLIPNGLLEGLKALRSLDISHNRIFHLQEQVFTGLSALRKLNVSFNRIEYVDAEVFTPLTDIQNVDLSHNDVVQFFEPYFANNKRLQVLNLSNMWVSGSFTSSETATRSLMEIEKLISTLGSVEKLDISDNVMTSIPETLTHAPNLRQVYMDGNKWECGCQDRWFLDWVATVKVSIGEGNSTEGMWCYVGKTAKQHFSNYMKNLSRSCSNTNIIARTPYKYQAVMGKDKQLNCHAQKPHWPKITWITPSKEWVSEDNDSSSNSVDSQWENERVPRVSADGSLHLSNVTGVDYGLYLCIASYKDLNITHYVHLGVDVNIFREVKLMSILVGWAFSLSFLLLVLIIQLVIFILEKLGVRCITSPPTTQQTRRVRAFFDSMEQHKTTQLDWLRDNYNMQAKKIKDNCYSQLERIRESYSNQSKNLGEIRDFGTQQLHTLRDQYNDQVRRVANYSAHQLCKVRENYVFKRNQVCKFSSHKLLRIRETYKWQAQTLNKILENLPRGLNFDTCRGMGACGRTDSIYLDDFGDEFGFLHHDLVHAEVYQMTSGHSLSGFKSIEGSGDKMEHVSLLIPPEFVNDYHQSTSAEDKAPRAQPEKDEEDDFEEERQHEIKIEDKIAVVCGDEEEAMAGAAAAVVCEENASNCSSEPATVILESSSGSYSSETIPPQLEPEQPTEKDVEAEATTTLTTAITIATPIDLNAMESGKSDDVQKPNMYT